MIRKLYTVALKKGDTMIDQVCLKEATAQYKKDFLKGQWETEKYKWEAVRCFQDNWNINADDFAEMLSRSLSKTGNLLTSKIYYPMGMITNFAKAAPMKYGQCSSICSMRTKIFINE